MRDFLLLCTKNAHFSYNSDISTQIDDVAMGSHLDPVSITILWTLRKHINPWKKYVDGTISCIKVESFEHVF